MTVNGLVVTRGPGGFIVRQSGVKGEKGDKGDKGDPGSGGGGATTLDGLTDVNATSPNAGQGIAWDGNSWDLIDLITQAALDAKLDDSQKGASGGLAELDGSGHVPAAQLNITGTQYKGLWNATTNSPSITDGTGTAGDFYWISVAGTRNLGSGSTSWVAGNRVLYNGSIWEQGVSSSAVVSVAGYSGIVTAGNLATALALAFQPYDSDLTSIAALSTTSFGRSLLTQADAAAARTTLGVASAGITANTVTDNYTLVLGDAGKIVEMNAATGKAITVPPNSSVAFPVGTLIDVCSIGVGLTTIVEGSGVTVRPPGAASGGGTIALQSETANLRKRATNDWVLSGDIV